MLIRTPPAAPARSGIAAPWRDLFVQHLAQMSAPLCALSTLHPAPGPPTESSGRSRAGEAVSQSQSQSRPTMATPRVRVCVYRGLWASLPDRATNPAPRNPSVYESDLPVFTTDARMAKAWEIAASGEGGARGGGGGPVEAVWWAAAAGTEWRVRGRAWLLGPDVDGSPGEAARAAIEARMRRQAGAGGEGPDAQSKSESASWSWSREVTAHFGNLSPAMRGSFRNPPPGQPRPAAGSPSDSLGQPVEDEDLNSAEARAHFRVCVIVPDEVEQVDLSRADDPRRWLWTYVGADGEGGGPVHEGGELMGEWERLEVWP